MIRDLGIDSIAINNGFLSADVKLKTDNGVVAARFAFELRKHPGLDAVIDQIDLAIREALSNSMGIIPETESPKS